MKKRLTVLVLAFAMVLTMSASVFADDVPTGSKTTAKITKYVKSADGVNHSGSYVLTFTAVATQTSTAAETPIPTEANATFSVSGEGDQYVSKDIDTVFTGKTFPHSGHYQYTVVEKLPTAGANQTLSGRVLTDTATAGVTKKTDYDGSNFTLHVYVKNGDNGPEIDKVSVADKDGHKVDPTDADPTNDNNGSGADQGDTDGFTFVNKFEETLETTPDVNDPDNPANNTYGALSVTKVVKDLDASLNLTDKADYADKTKPFSFTITVKKPANSTATKVTGVKYEGTTAGTPEEKTFDSNGIATFNVTLTDADAFAFTQAPAGMKYTIEEGAAENYKGFYSITSVNGTAVAQVAGTGLNTALSTTERTFTDKDNGAKANFVNGLNPEDITPTGIIINNLPYVLLIGLAIGGIVLFSRKRRYE